jgi:hypothetical protein
MLEPGLVSKNSKPVTTPPQVVPGGAVTRVRTVNAPGTGRFPLALTARIVHPCPFIRGLRSVRN